MFRILSRSLALAAVLPALSVAPTVRAGTLLLDNFAAPATSISLVAPSQDFVTSQAGTYAGVAGQYRAAYYFPYWPSPAAAAGNIATIGNGGVAVAAAPGTIGELELGYGAYGAPPGNLGANGPFLNVDLSSYDALHLTFSSLDKPLNVVVGFYTNNPAAGSGFLYYLDAEVSLDPAAGGGPVSGDVLFKGADSTTPSALFNFSQVDGMVVIFDRAASVDGNRYNLTSLSFTQAVPEPGSAALLFTGLLFIGVRGMWRVRRSAP